MKKLYPLLAAALAGGYIGLAGVARGADVGAAPAAGILNQERLEWTVLIPELYNTLYLAGTIARVDRDKDTIVLNTDVHGDVELQLPLAAMRGIRVGDVVVVNLGFSVDERTVSAESCDALPIKVASC